MWLAPRSVRSCWRKRRTLFRRNNLAIAYFQSGRGKVAVAVVEETRQMFPDNRFAEATLAKLYFLTGRAAEAQPLADNIVANPPTGQDAIVTALETLAFLGRDEDVVRLAETVSDEELVDQQSQAIRLHYYAYAKCRLGDPKAAKALWKECLERFEQLTEARENLDDMQSDDRHAPWGASFGKWIPRDVMDVLIDSMRPRKAHRPDSVSRDRGVDPGTIGSRRSAWP